MKHLTSIFFLLLTSYSVFAAATIPLNDNVLFAFDKCKALSVNLKKTALSEMTLSAFDIHCVVTQHDKLLFNCDFFDAASDEKKSMEALSGGKTDKVGQLSNLGGTTIKFNFENGSASFESSLDSKDSLTTGKKVCAGIFLLEKDALKRKK